MDENMTVFEENENLEVAENENCEDSGKGILGKILVGAVIAAGAGVGAALYKNRDKLEQRRIAKLEKKGYRVFKAAEIVEEEVEADNDETK